MLISGHLRGFAGWAKRRVLCLPTKARHTRRMRGIQYAEVYRIDH